MNNIKPILKKRRLFLVGIITILTLYSCVPTKTIREANNTVPEHYKNHQTDTTNAASVKWKDFFSDPNLIALIDMALANNQELNIMLQQVELSKNEIKTRTGEYLPFVGMYAGAEVEKVGEFTRNGSVEHNLNVREDEKFPEPLNNFRVGISASWELDIWKKLRNGKKAAVLEYLASIEGKNFMTTQLVSEIASTYYELMALDNQLEIIEQNLEIQQNALKMAVLQKEAARVTQLAVSRFEAEVFKNQSNKYLIEQQIYETENLINFLIGRYPQPIIRSSNDFISKTVDTFNAGIPSQLLANRPDLNKAQHELYDAKVYVQIGKAP